MPVLEAGQADGRRFLASTFIDGKTLDEISTAGRSTSPIRRALHAARRRPASQALHEAGIVHRDLKPSNIISTDRHGDAHRLRPREGPAYTVLTKPGQVMGTLDYLAPELVKGHPASPATDIYSLGAPLYEGIAGKPPFGGRPWLQVGMAHLYEPAGCEQSPRAAARRRLCAHPRPGEDRRTGRPAASCFACSRSPRRRRADGRGRPRVFLTAGTRDGSVSPPASVDSSDAEDRAEAQEE